MHARPENLFILAMLIAPACAAPDEDTGAADGGATDGGAADGGATDGGADTGGDGNPFEVVIESYDSGCGLKELETYACEAVDLVVVSARDDAELEAMYEAHMHRSPPETDMEGRVALLSYLPWCNEVKGTLHVDHVTVDGTALRVDEVLELYEAPPQAEACLYNLVTIPSTGFTTIETTMTEVMAE